jgi:hypothetical protein
MHREINKDVEELQAAVKTTNTLFRVNSKTVPVGNGLNHCPLEQMSAWFEPSIPSRKRKN